MVVSNNSVVMLAGTRPRAAANNHLNIATTPAVKQETWQQQQHRQHRQRQHRQRD
jgi:hypothetical protein